MLKLLRKNLQQILEDIDSGNCTMSDTELSEAIELMSKMNKRSRYLNRTDAAEYLHMSQRTFDRYVHDGIIPKGEHYRGDKQLFWREQDLDNVRL